MYFKYICHRCCEKTWAYLAITFRQLIGTSHLHSQQSLSVIFCHPNVASAIILLQNFNAKPNNHLMQRDAILTDTLLFVLDFEPFPVFIKINCHQKIKLAVEKLLYYDNRYISAEWPLCIIWAEIWGIYILKLVWNINSSLHLQLTLVKMEISSYLRHSTLD